jgi:hypothetical protein
VHPSATRSRIIITPQNAALLLIDYVIVAGLLSLRTAPD